MQYTAYKAILISCLPPFLLAVFLFSCTHTPNIVGKWQEPGKTSAIEFRQDGTFTAIDDMGMTVNGNYSIPTHGKIRLEIKHSNSSDEMLTGSIAVQDDTLILINEKDKEKLLYRKSQQ